MGLIERELGRKLLAEHHLSVPERRWLPGGRIRFSDLVAAVDEGLAESGWFPHPLRPDHVIGEGALVEARQGELWLHEQHEVGVGRFGPIRSYQVADLAEAVRAYIDADGGAPLDGVAVDWEA